VKFRSQGDGELKGANSCSWGRFLFTCSDTFAVEYIVYSCNTLHHRQTTSDINHSWGQ